MPIHDVIRQRLQPLTASVTSNRIMLYALFSTCAMFGAIANACISQSNFYSVMIHLSRSGRSVLILANFGFLATLLVGKILQRVFFGPLQPREVERLYDQTWMFVTESLLAFTIFRDDFDVPFVLMFGFLLFVKCFHWLMADRIESMDQVNYPGPPVLFHVRMNILFMTLCAVDFIMFTIAVDSTITHGVGGMVLFATEYAILMASALNAMARYSLNNLDYRRAANRGGDNAPPWEHKSMYIFYIELVTDFLKLATYLTFFTIILTFYGLPLNIIRDVYLTARSFISRLRALIRYQNATRDMDRRYPNATEEELTAMSDRTCIICREELSTTEAPADAPAVEVNPNDGTPPVPPQMQDGPNMTPKKLPCGHIFHFQCLRSWLERQQSCPTCRRTVLETDNTNRNGNPQQRQQRPQPNGGARPQPLQPGAAPQPFQPLQPQVMQQQQNQGSFFGFLRRALGLAAQPPLVPGQFPNQFGPQPFGPQMPPHHAYGHPAPQGYYYPQHYYPYPPQQPQPQQLHPAPIVRGFYGPGGVWHPWPVDQAQDQNAHAQNPPPAPTPSAAQPQPHSQPPPPPGLVPMPVPMSLSMITTPPSVPAAPAATRPPAPPSGSSSSMSSVSTTDEDSTSSSESGDESSRTPSGPAARSAAATPRDAAALAALRRLGMQAPSKRTATPSSSGSVSGTSSAVEVRPTVSASTSATIPDTATATALPTTSTVPTLPITDSPANTAQSTPTVTTISAEPNPSGSSSTTTANAPQRAPALLPLYDPTRPAGPQGVTYIQQYAANPYQNPNVAWRSSANPLRLHPVNPAYPHPYPQARPSPYPSTSAQLQPHSHQHQPRPGGSSSSRNFRPNLSTLPSTLTDDQLSRLDRVTRDAIDERLRVLEGVSLTVHRCIEELTRVRSVLPPGSVGSALAGSPMGQQIPAPGEAVPATVQAAPGAAVTPEVTAVADSTSVADATSVTQSSDVAELPVAIVDDISGEDPSASFPPRDDLLMSQWAKVELPVNDVDTPTTGSTSSDPDALNHGAVGALSSRREEKKKATLQDTE